VTDLYRDTHDLRGWLEGELHKTHLQPTRHPTVGVNPKTNSRVSVENGTRHLPDTSDSFDARGENE
jgi:hypothetical protein